MKNNAYEILGPPAILLLLLSALQFNGIKKLENTTIDWRYKVRAENDKASHPDIVMLGIDEESLIDFGAWPWSRERHRQLLEFLRLMPPKVITFDVFFPEHTNGDKHSEVDLAFADAMLSHESIITAAVTLNDAEVSEEGMEIPSIDLMGLTEAIPPENIIGDVKKVRTTTYSLYPVQLFRDSSYFGFADADPSAIDGIRRHIPVVIKTGGHVFPSLILQTLMRYYDVFADSVFIEIGKQVTIKLPEGDSIVIPINDRAEYYVNYRSQATFTAHGYSDLIKTLAAVHEGIKEWPATYPTVENKILLIGQVAKGLSDMGPTPLQGKGPLVFVQANILNNILTNDYLYQADHQAMIIGWLLITWMTVLGLKGRTIWIASGVPLALIGLYTGYSLWQCEHKNLELPVFWPV